MTTNELKETCRKKGISFIPHHECGLCGQPTGWYLFERWPPYEVAYSSACGCCDSEARRSTWQEVLDWVCDKDGTLRPEYEYLQPDPANTIIDKEMNEINWQEAFEDENFMTKLRNTIEETFTEHTATEEDFDEMMDHKASPVERIKAELLARKEKYTRRGEESDAMHDGKGMYWGGVLSALNEVLTVIEQIERED